MVDFQIENEVYNVSESYGRLYLHKHTMWLRNRQPSYFEKFRTTILKSFVNSCELRMLNFCLERTNIEISSSCELETILLESVSLLEPKTNCSVNSWLSRGGCIPQCIASLSWPRSGGPENCRAARRPVGSCPAREPKMKSHEKIGGRARVRGLCLASSAHSSKWLRLHLPAWQGRFFQAVTDGFCV